MASAGEVRLKLRLSSVSSPYLQVKVTSSPSAKANTPILTLPSTGAPLVAYLNVTAVGFTPTSYSWTWVADSLNSYAPAPSPYPTSTAPFGTPAQQTKFTVSKEGVYQFALTASNGSQVVTKNIWVNIWSYKSALNTDRSIGNNPGILPPSSVRTLSPDPGAFNHPRLLFTANDWLELSKKVTSSTEVSEAIASMKSMLSAGFDAFDTDMGNLATVFSAYEQANYSSDLYSTVTSIYKTFDPTNTTSVNGEQLLGKNPLNSMYDALACACYVEWLNYDATLPITGASAPQQARFSYLASVIAGAAQFEYNYFVTSSGSASDGRAIKSAYSKYTLAFCYDVAYNWMTTTQQRVTRSYLYAIGYLIYNNGKGGITYTAPYVPSGSNQNGGDFANLAEGINLAALAIEGEESTVSASVQAAYIAYAAPVKTAWAGASASSVSNLHRQIRHNTEWNLTHWGFVMNMTDYFVLGQSIATLASLAFARRWEDQFVSTHYYQTCIAILYQLSPLERSGELDMCDHHDGGGLLPGPRIVAAIMIAKYMYPDDPATDYMYRVLKRESDSTNHSLVQAIFATDPFTTTLSAVASAKGLSTLKFDPHRAMCITKNGWDDNDFMLQFENRWDFDGHMHAEKNNFSLYALGRAWANPAGYHITINDVQSSILIQNLALISDKATSGYIGQSPSSATQTLTNNNFPPVPAALLEVREDPAQLWTIFSGDASTAYTYAKVANAGSVNFDTGVALASLAYPGLTGALLNEDYGSFSTGNLSVGLLDYNPVYNAKRTVFTVRDANKVHPYSLVLDDFTKDGTARNYRWTMPNCISFGLGNGRFVNASGVATYSSLAILSGTATPTEVIVYHDPIDTATVSGQANLPRLLVRDVANISSNSSQPKIFIDDRPTGSGFSGGNLTYGIDNNSGTKELVKLASRRLMIERDNVISPGFQVLLYPFKSTSTNRLPTTTWTSATTLQISHVNGETDIITFAAKSAIPASGAARIAAFKSAFTTITAFSRGNGKQALPTITVPKTSKVVCTSRNDQGLPTCLCNFSISAKDARGQALAFSSNGAKGKYLPTGIQRVWVSAVDKFNQQVSRSFIVIVLPSAPVPVLTQVTNLGKPYSATIDWPFWTGVTGYRVKRSTIAGGPYTTIATLSQYTTSYTDSAMPAATTFYVVTPLLKAALYGLNYEGPASTPVSTAPPAVGTTLGQAVGGVSVRSSSTGSSDYLLSNLSGKMTSDDQPTLAAVAVSGNGNYIARCKSYTTTTFYGSFGILYKGGLTTKSVAAFVGFSFTLTPQIVFSTRITDGASYTTQSYSSATINYPNGFPLYFRLQRTGQMFFAYWSQDGSSWTPVGSGTVRIANMPTDGCFVSLAIQGAAPCTADFDVNTFLP
eukprot:TRINITY_DN216_c0_g1_i1.p1 TRINITY_DN216_c0_g1~~TRINITY_DN216_c0_g1_i1.p1  ORF type:complete len:1380 (+),score=133.09 TRINITY_DN216_c0_g1_i1:578-4717(+)